MKEFAIPLLCAVVVSFAHATNADVLPGAVTPVHVPAGNLDDAVESLAKQTGVNVMYAGTLLDGRTTGGVEGAFTPDAAFGKLLEGTSLQITTERGSLRIAQAPAATPAAENAIPAATAAPAGATASECHRVMKGNRVDRYCGSADQWKDLQVRVGFRCRREGKRDELCAAASDWKRFDLSRASMSAIDSRVYSNGEIAASVEQNHPSFTVQPTVSAPVAPAPAPAPAPAH